MPLLAIAVFFLIIFDCNSLTHFPFAFDEPFCQPCDDYVAQAPETDKKVGR